MSAKQRISYVSRAVECEFCGNQRSIGGQNTGVKEGQVDDLMNFEKSVKHDDRQKAGPEKKNAA